MANNPLRDSSGDFIEAVVISTCSGNHGNNTIKHERKFRLGREWHGRGFMTREIPYEKLCDFSHFIAVL